MAYNLESLVQILDQILHPSPHDPWILDPTKKPEIESLFEKARSLRVFFAKSLVLTGDKIESLESRITNAVHEAEDILESHLAEGIRSTHDGEKFTLQGGTRSTPEGEKFTLQDRNCSTGVGCMSSFFRRVGKKSTFFPRRTNAKREAEDILESHLVNETHSTHDGQKFIFSPRDDLQKVIAELDYVEKEVKEMASGSCMFEIDSPSTVDWSRSAADLNPKNVMVGFDKDLIQLKDRITRQQLKVEIIPIVGMGGMGKTTLARNVYDDALIISRFDRRAWIVVPQDYNVRGILLSLLLCFDVSVSDEEMPRLENEELAEKLYKHLYGRRYLIVLDDMWDFKAWDDVKKCFPNNNNGSRVLITTRESNVANYLDSSKNSHHNMHFLNTDDSWNLLRQKVFTQENCPCELEKIGQKIANNCGGLPLAIHVIGGVLSQAKRTQNAWNEVAKDVSSAIAGKDGRVMELLSLSYNHLPLPLRPCFLYMGVFPEDHEIRASNLVSLWVAEAFLTPSEDKSLEEIGEMYLKALVDRNLLLIRQRDTNGNVKSCSIHDLLRDLCMKKAHQEKLFPIRNQQVYTGNALNWRRVSAHSSDRLKDMYSSIESIGLARSFLFVGAVYLRSLSKVVFELKLLRVLDILGIALEKFPLEVLQLVNLRYLALASHSGLPSSITLLWNLQTLIFQKKHMILGLLVDWPHEGTHEIFNLRRLRHMKLKDCYFRSKLFGGKSFPLLEDLRTLTGLLVEHDFDKVLESAPNLNKLGICGYSSVSYNIDLSGLSKLKTLKCSFVRKSNPQLSLSFIIFPHCIRKLSLKWCVISPEFMNKIGTLPNLEVLKLRECVFVGRTWGPTEGEFCKLQFLLLESLNLVNLVADESHFPRLRHLVVRGCFELKEIPLGIGDISTLEMIEVQKSSPSVADSARKIQEEQLELENHGLQVRITD